MSTHLRKALERETSIEATAWDGALPPASIHTVVEPAELGTTREELLDVAARCKALARQPSLTPREQAALEAQRRSALAEIRRLDTDGPLEQHPAFDAHVEDVLSALERTLEHYGVNPDGARTVFGQCLEELEAKRTRRAA